MLRRDIYINNKETKKMKVTIITSCYNRVKTIRGCIESVLAQDYPDIEYIVVDGASTDGSMDVINEYKDRIAKIISEPDHGMYEAINKGLRAATGDIVGLVHSDDFLFSNHTVSNIVKRFEETHADFLYGDGLFVDAVNTQKVVRNWIGAATACGRFVMDGCRCTPLATSSAVPLSARGYITRAIRLRPTATCSSDICSGES